MSRSARLLARTRLSGSPRLGVACPHCGHRVSVRTSRQVTEIFRELWGICTHCGFTGKAHIAWDVEAAPSLTPNPRVQLPGMNHREATETFAADDRAGTSPDQEPIDMFPSTG